MKIALLIMVFSGKIWATSIYLLPKVSFFKSEITLSFLPNNPEEIYIKKCSLYLDTKKILDVEIDIAFKSYGEIRLIEKKIKYPMIFNKSKEIDEIKINCDHPQVKVSSWMSLDEN